MGGNVPVLGTAKQAIRLTVTNAGTVFKITWLPVALSALMSIWPLTRFPNRDFSGLSLEEIYLSMGTYNGLNLFASLVANLLIIMTFVGIFRFYLREEKPRLPFYLHWGMDEWRVLGGAILSFFAIMLTAIGAFIVVGIASLILFIVATVLGMTPSLEEMQTLTEGGITQVSDIPMIFFLWYGFVFLAILAAVTWIWGRVLFFYPGPVAEGKLDVRALFAATEGQVLRILGAFILVSLVVYPLLFLVGFLIDMTITRGAMAQYIGLMFWAPDQPLPFDPGSELTRLMVGGFVFNCLSRMGLPFIAATYTLAYLYRSEEQ